MKFSRSSCNTFSIFLSIINNLFFPAKGIEKNLHEYVKLYLFFKRTLLKAYFSTVQNIKKHHYSSPEASPSN